MEQQVQLPETFADLLEYVRNILIARYVTRQYQGVLAKVPGQFFDIILEPLTLVRESEFGSRLMPGLGNGPRDGPFVRHPKNDSELVLEYSRHGGRPR